MATRKGSSTTPGPVRVVQTASGEVPIQSPVKVAGRFAGLQWAPVSAAGTGKRSKGSQAPIRAEWSPEIITASQAIGFYLPELLPERRKARTLKDGTVRPATPWRLCGEPSDLSALLQPIPEASPGGKDSAQLVAALLHGMGGELPSLAAGQGLPLLDVLEVFTHPAIFGIYKKNQGLQYLVNNKQSNITLLHRFAEHSGRYCYMDGEMIFLSDSADS